MHSVLLIDNSSHYFELKQALEIAGFRVIYANTDLQGLEALLHSTYDLIILSKKKCGIDDKLLCEYLERVPSKTILTTISSKQELEVSLLPEGDLPTYFSRFFIETIQYLHNRQQTTSFLAPLRKTVNG